MIVRGWCVTVSGRFAIVKRVFEDVRQTCSAATINYMNIDFDVNFLCEYL